MVAPGRIFFSRPSSNRVLLGLKWREIYYLGGGVIVGIICSFYVVRSLAGLLSIVILPALGLALAKVKIYGLSPAKVLTRTLSLRLKPLATSPTFDRSGNDTGSAATRSLDTRSVDTKWGGRGTRLQSRPTRATKASHRSELEAPTHRKSSERSPAVRVLKTPLSVAMVTNGARDAVVYQASYCPTWSRVAEEASAESQIWASSIMDQCKKLPRGTRAILRVEVVPEPTATSEGTGPPTILQELEEQLQRTSFRVLTHLAFSVPHKSSKGSIRRGMGLKADGQPFENLSLLSSSELESSLARWTFGTRSNRASCDQGADYRIRELWDRLVIDSTKICVLEVVDWPSAALTPGFLWSFVKPAPPTRTFTVEFAPFDDATARRRIRSRSSELIAQRHLRERSGYLDDATDQDAERSRRRQEEELVQGESLLRFGAICCVYSESSHSLKAEVEKTISLAQSIGVDLRVAYGSQKALFISSFFTGGIF